MVITDIFGHMVSQSWRGVCLDTPLLYFYMTLFSLKYRLEKISVKNDFRKKHIRAMGLFYSEVLVHFCEISVQK